jgi:Ca2+-transporting ATPase
MPVEELVGLTGHEAAKRLAKDGFNELPTAKPKTLLDLAAELVKEPMIFLLIACSSIYFFLGEINEGLMLLVSIFGVMAISLYQEKKTENSLEALRNLASPRALVIRDGLEKRISGREVVVGDLILLNEGDRVPADAIIISSTNLHVDESLLTGESVAVEKHSKVVKESKDNSVYSGSMIVKGHGVAEVTATGINTEMGKIGKSLNSINIENTLLQKEVARVIKIIATGGLFLCLGLTLVYWLTRGNLIQGFLAGLTLAMGIIPEEFPIVLTIFLTMGAWRLAQSKVLTRRAATIETLGSATVLCVDKTGTLTKNKMTILEVYQPGKKLAKLEDATELAEYGVLACPKKPFDPMETAFIDFGKVAFGSLEEIYRGHEIKKEYTVEKESLSVVNLWSDGSKYLVAAKGAPETILDLCHVDKEEEKLYLKKVREMAGTGLRVLAVAKGKYSGKAFPKNRHEIEYEMVGLVGLADPIRSEIKKAVAEAYTAGIRVVMITGDYPETALNIARQINLSSAGVLTGNELEDMTEGERRKALTDVNIFSRVTPEQKLMIVNALKENKEVVAMTGDGVNDAPALKSAFIGIAMGQRGTDVAREAASIVLLDDNFSSIVNGVRVGRRIYDNLQKAMTFLIAVHIPVVVLSLIPVLMKWPLVLLPAHIVLLELLIDPACTLVFEAEKEDKAIMERKPRKLKDSIFNFRMVNYSLFQGLFVAATTVFVYYNSLTRGLPVDRARTITFLTLIVANLFLILVNLSTKDLAIARLVKTRNVPLLSVLAASSLVMWFLTTNATLKKIFMFETLGFQDVLKAIFVGFLTVLWVEIYKIIKKKFAKNY